MQIVKEKNIMNKNTEKEKFEDCILFNSDEKIIAFYPPG